MMSEKDCLNSHGLSWRRKVYSDWEDVTMSSSGTDKWANVHFPYITFQRLLFSYSVIFPPLFRRSYRHCTVKSDIGTAELSSIIIFPTSDGEQLSQILGLGGSRSMPPLSLLSSLPSNGLPRWSGQSPLTRCQTFWCNLCIQTALLNPHWCLMYTEISVHAQFSHCRKLKVKKVKVP